MCVIVNQFEFFRLDIIQLDLNNVLSSKTTEFMIILIFSFTIF